MPSATDRAAVRVSVALCTFDGARFLAEQLESILAQSPPADEIVVRDDGSRDGIVALIDAWHDRHPATIRRLPAGARLGAAGNFAAVLAATRGATVMLADQDDRWPPGRQAALTAALDAIPPDRPGMAFSDARLIDEAGRPIGSSWAAAHEITATERAALAAGDAFDAQLRRNLVTGATAAVNRALIDAALPIPPGWLHDEWLATLAAACGGLRYLDQPLLDYRQHGANVVGMRPLTTADRVRRVLGTAPGDAARRLQRLQQLHERLLRLGDAVTARHRAALADALALARHRASLPPARLARIAPILSQLADGRYRRRSTGWKMALRDLLAPPAAPHARDAD